MIISRGTVDAYFLSMIIARCTLSIFSWVPLSVAVCCSLLVFADIFSTGGFLIIFPELLMDQNPVFSAISKYDT